MIRIPCRVVDETCRQCHLAITGDAVLIPLNERESLAWDSISGEVPSFRIFCNECANEVERQALDEQYVK